MKSIKKEPLHFLMALLVPSNMSIPALRAAKTFFFY